MPSLPRLFVLGDSISKGYGPHLKAALCGVCRYTRKTGWEPQLGSDYGPRTGNAGNSRRVLGWLKAMKKGGGVPADLLLFNCGLHDLKVTEADRRVAVPRAEYRTNLRANLRLARAMGLTVIWVTTTPIEEKLHLAKMTFARRQRDVLAYNAIAREVMRAARVPVCDLWTFTKNLGANLTADGVHFRDPIRKQQAAFIAGWLGAWLTSRR